MPHDKDLLKRAYAVVLRNPEDDLRYTIGHYDTHPESRADDDVVFHELKGAYSTPKKLAFYLSRTVIPSNMEIARKIRHGGFINIWFRLPEDLIDKYDEFSMEEEKSLMETLRNDMKKQGNLR